jgi:hypothetical protein
VRASSRRSRFACGVGSDLDDEALWDPRASLVVQLDQADAEVSSPVEPKIRRRIEVLPGSL